MNESVERNAELDNERAIMRASIPITRMTDYGLDVATGLRILAGFDQGKEWEDVAEFEAERWLSLADDSQGQSRDDALRKAVATLFMAQLGINRDNDRKRDLYVRLQTAVAALAAENSETMSVARIPFAGRHINSLVVRPPGPPTPAVIIVGGMNGWGPAYLSQAEALSARGLTALLVEVPGTGHTRLVEGLYGSAGVADSLLACADWLAESLGLPQRFGIWGNSFGGLFAGLAAGKDDRFVASCLNGGAADPINTSMSVPVEFLADFFGTPDPEAVRQHMESLTFVGHGYTLNNPIVLYAVPDRIFDVRDQQPFFDAGGSTARWVEWDDGEHALYNYAIQRNAIVGDWFHRHLC